MNKFHRKIDAYKSCLMCSNKSAPERYYVIALPAHQVTVIESKTCRCDENGTRRVCVRARHTLRHDF